MPTPPILSPREAATILHSGAIVAYATEAVWGMGCDPFDETAVLRLLALKQRSVDKGLIVIAASIDQLKPLIDFGKLPTERLTEVLSTWPGPHTWVMPAEATVPKWITGTHDGIAVRITSHQCVIALCDAFGGPLVSTSANRAGAPAPTTLEAFDPTLCASMDAIVPGATGTRARPSSIRDALTGASLRA